PAISEKTSGLATVIRAANSGIVVAGNSYMEKLLKCDSIVFDDSVAWHMPETGKETFARMAQNQGLAEIVFLASSSAESKRTYIEQRQELGHSVIYVGDCATESAVAEQADVAISVLEPPYNQRNKSSIALLTPDLMKILELRAIAVDAINEFKVGFGLSLAPNLVAVFGALFLASPTSVAVLLTNLGMLADFIRSGAILHLAETEAQE